MKAEFLRDQNNNVWFVNAKDFQFRKCPNTAGLESLDDDLLQEEKMRQMKEAQQAELQKELADFDAALQQKPPRESKHKKYIYSVMENHYSQMRDTLQVDGFFVERAYDCTVPNWKQKGSPGREYMRK